MSCACLISTPKYQLASRMNAAFPLWTNAGLVDLAAVSTGPLSNGLRVTGGPPEQTHPPRPITVYKRAGEPAGTHKPEELTAAFFETSRGERWVFLCRRIHFETHNMQTVCVCVCAGQNHEKLSGWYPSGPRLRPEQLAGSSAGGRRCLKVQKSRPNPRGRLCVKGHGFFCFLNLFVLEENIAKRAKKNHC